MVEPSEDLVLVFNKAVADAKQLNHEYVTIEHLLFAALCTESLDKLLAEFGTDVAALKNALENYLKTECNDCLLYTSPSPRDLSTSRMPSSA